MNTLSLFSQDVDISKDNVMLDKQAVAKILRVRNTDTFGFYTLQDEPMVYVFLTVCSNPNTVSTFITSYIEPKTHRIVNCYRKHKRDFKMKQGEAEGLIKLGFLSKDGFNKPALDSFFESGGKSRIPDAELEDVQKKLNLMAETNRINALNAKYNDGVYRNEKLNGYQFIVRDNKVFRTKTNDPMDKGEYPVGSYITYDASNGTKVVEILGTNKVPLARGAYDKVALGNTVFTMYNNLTFQITPNLMQNVPSAIVPIYQELQVRDCPFDGVPNEQNSLYIPTNSEKGVAYLKVQDAAERIARSATFQEGILIKTNGEMFSSAYKIDATPVSNGGSIANTKIDGGKKVYRKFTNEKGKSKEETIDAEDCKMLILGKDTFDIVKFKPSVVSNGSGDLGKFLFVKSTERFARRIYLNSKVGIYDFEGSPVVLDITAKEGFSAKEIGAIKKLKELSKPCPQALDNIEKDQYTEYSAALVEWAQKLDNCK